MNCPNCAVVLTVAERQGIEIDYCPRCRGVWLDRGELDKIIERSSSPAHYNDDDSDWGDDRRKPQYGSNQPGYPPPGPGGGYPPQKRKGFFGQLFDFD
ncbi:MAG: zf-TFIIB domain-containing protein [Gemmataceae bacterium]